MNSTVGQRIAFENLKERTEFMRRLRGENVYPKVMLSSASMRTRYGIKQRPDFEIVDWVTLGGPESAPALAPPSKPSSAEIIGEDLPY
jgi:hypothetical protein